MKKVLLALGNKDIENVIKKRIEATENYSVVDIAAYRKIIIDKVAQNLPDIVVVNETIPGQENPDRGRRRFRARLGAQPPPDCRGNFPDPPPRRFPRRAALGRANAQARRRRQSAFGNHRSQRRHRRRNA